MFKRPYYFVLSFSLKYNYIIFSSLLLPQIPLALAPFQSHSLFFFDIVIHTYRHTNTHIPKYLNTTCSDCLLLLMCIWFKSCSVDVSIRVGIPWSFSFCILTSCVFFFTSMSVEKRTSLTRVKVRVIYVYKDKYSKLQLEIKQDY